MNKVIIQCTGAADEMGLGLLLDTISWTLMNKRLLTPDRESTADQVRVLPKSNVVSQFGFFFFWGGDCLQDCGSRVISWRSNDSKTAALPKPNPAWV